MELVAFVVFHFCVTHLEVSLISKNMYRLGTFKCTIDFRYVNEAVSEPNASGIVFLKYLQTQGHFL